MEQVVKHRRGLIGLAVLALLALVIPVRGSDLPAAMVLMLIEACVIGLVPLVVGFLVQLTLADRELRDRVLFFYAVIIALAFGVITNSSESSFGRQVIGVAFFAVLLTWFAGLGAASARAVRRRRRVTT